MKRIIHYLFAASTMLLTLETMAQLPEKYVGSKMHIKFYSTTPVEDIEAHNYTAVSTIKPATGEVVFSVPMQGFEFKKAMMQQHFNNEHFLETNVYPKSKFKGAIVNLSEIDFSKDGTYEAQIEGALTIKDKTNSISDTGTIQVKGDQLVINSVFDITLADYGITFDDSEKVSKKIAKTVEVTVEGEYQ